uniref:Uncharacterized protein n=1 Tax=Oncorhynchus tshawytscha TaxID=74940 RepID=A0A8C8LSW6_ONCTS
IQSMAKREEGVVIGGDRRADSPCHSAKESIMTTHFKLCFIEANILLSIVCNFQCILIVNITLLDITRKVEAVARDKGCQTVKKWIESIKNHLYWSVWQVGLKRVARWSACNKWLKPATKPTLEKQLLNKWLRKDFHSVILWFAPKNLYHFRLYLAGLQLNENANCSNCRGKRLLDVLFIEVIPDPAPYEEKVCELSIPEPLCAQYDRPDKEEAIASVTQGKVKTDLYRPFHKRHQNMFKHLFMMKKIK